MPLVSLTVFVPLLGAVLLVALPRPAARTAHAIGLVASGLALVGAIGIWIRGIGPGFSQVEEVGWIPSSARPTGSGSTASASRSCC